MPRDWEPRPIPLGNGADTSASDLAQRPPSLTVAENWLLTKDGVLAPRPGLKLHNGRTWTSALANPDQDGAYGTAGVIPTSSRTIAKVRSGGGELPLLLTNGRAYHLQDHTAAGGTGDWHDLGSFWSASVQRLGFVDQTDPFGGAFAASGAAATSAGHYIVRLPGGAALAAHGADGQRISIYQPTNVPAGKQASTYACVLGSDAAVVYNTAAGQLVLVSVSSTDPHSWTETVLATDARTTGGQFQEAVYSSAVSRLFIAYLTTTTTQIKLLAVTTAHSVGATVTYTHGTALGSVAIGRKGSRLVVGGCESAAALDIITKVYSEATTPVDQAIDATIAPSGVGVPRLLVIGPHSTANTAVVAWNTTDDGNAELRTRSTTAATVSGNSHIWSGTNPTASTPAFQYMPRYAPWVVGGRTLMGLSVGGHETTAASVNFFMTWAIIDVTVSASDDLRYSELVAQGVTGGTAAQWPSNVDPRDVGSALFTSADFTAYDEDGLGDYYSIMVNRLDHTRPIPVAEADGAWLIGGSTTYHYDGTFLVEAGVVHPPYAKATAIAGGSVPAGTYACAVVWSWTDALGKIHRSAPSNITNATVTGGLPTIRVGFVTPELSKREGWFAEVYISAVNPPAGGVFPLFRQDALAVGYAGAGSIDFPGPLAADTEPMYTDGGVLENYPPPGSDGGLVAVGNRVWAASGRTLAASKLLENGPPAWNETLELIVPAAGGSIRALAAQGENIVVFCERAIYMTGGAGPDDLLQGPPFADLARISDIGCTGPRAVAETVLGLVFQGRDLKLYTMSGLRAISHAVDDQLSTGPVDLIHWPEEDALVVMADAADPLVWNYRKDQWVRWPLVADNEDRITAHAGALVDGVLWTMDALTVGAVGYFVPGQTNDLVPTATDFYGVAETPWIRLDADRIRGWSRCGKLTVAGTALASGATLTVTVHRDGVKLLAPETHTAALTPVPGSPVATWPSERMAPEFQLARQKVSTIKLRLRSLRVSLVEMELDVRRAGPAAPPGQRVA